MIDLHLHLDGSLSEETVKQLARLAKIQLPEPLDKAMRAPVDCQSLNDYLRCFDLPLELLQSGEALELAAYHLGRELADQGLLYAEMRFAPQLHTRQGLEQKQAVEAVCAGLTRAVKESPDFYAQAILCCMRGGEPGANRLTLELAAEFLGKGVCAADLAGAEALYPTEDYQALFTDAAGLGLPFTLHAGEAAGPGSVWAAVNMGASRIGHGVRAAEDPALLALLAERAIPLELCLTSNLQTKAVPSPESFPLRDFLRQGICATLNTDNLAVSGTSLREEYQRFGATKEESRILLKNAVRAAFLPEMRKSKLLESVTARLG